MPRDFVVSEEELRNLMVTYYAGTFREAVDNFLKSKQPVEIYDKHTYLYQCAKEIDIYTNENINVYVEVIK